jgi:hypothetical protein
MDNWSVYPKRDVHKSPWETKPPTPKGDTLGSPSPSRRALSSSGTANSSYGINRATSANLPPEQGSPKSYSYDST